MRRLLAFTSLAAASCSPADTVAASSVTAADPVSQFAACAWDKVPTTTQNWSDAGASFSTIMRSDDTSAAKLLLLRMMSACPSDEFRLPTVPVYLQDRLVEQIAQQRPKTIGQDKPIADIARCEINYTNTDGDVIHTIAIFATTKDGELSKFQTLTAPAPAGLDQAAETSFCQTVQSDGSLIDA